MQLNRIHTIATALAALLAVTSCTDNNNTAQPSSPDGALSFAARNGSRSLIENDGDLHSSGFAVWGEYVSILNPGTPVRVFSGTPVTFDEKTGWGYTGTQYWFPGQKYSFVAVHPASAAADVQYNGNTSLTIADYNIIAENHKGTDLLAATETRQCTGASAMGVVNYSFKHLLTQLNFVPRINPAVTQNVVIESAYVYGIPSIGTWSGFDADGLAKWTVNTGSGSNVTTFDNPLGAMTTETTIKPDDTDSKPLFTSTNPMLCIPQTVPHDAVFRVTYHYEDTPDKSNTFIYRLQLASTTLTNGWEAGKTYRYTFEIGSNDFILFSKPEVVPWDDKGGSNIIIQGDQTT